MQPCPQCAPFSPRAHNVQGELICQVILHSPAAQLEIMADALWKPLVVGDSVKKSRSNSIASGKVPVDPQGGDALGDEGVRTVKAACIGKLTTMAPAKFLPQLQVCALLGSVHCAGIR